MYEILRLNYLEVLALFILLCCGLPIFIINYFDDYLGRGGSWGVLRLFLQGSVKGAVQWGSLAVKDPVLQETEPRGRRRLARADSVTVSATLWHILLGRPVIVNVDKPWVDLTTDEDGQLYLTRLLMEVGLVREVTSDHEPDPVYPSGTPENIPKENRTIPMEAQVRVRNTTVRLEEGSLLLPEETAELFGDGVFIQAAVGEERVKAALARSRGERQPEEDEGGGAGEDGAWYQLRNKPQETETSGQPLYPVIVDATSDRMEMRAQGWRTTTGLLLARPIRTAFDFTPSLARMMLAKVHPLLGAAVGLHQGDRITSFLMPLAGHHPADVWHVRALPMKLSMQTKGLLSGLLHLLRLSGGRLEAWAGQMEAHIYRSGVIVSQRLDILLGSNVDSGKGIHVATWGRVDTSKGNACSMTLGIPAPTLNAAGLLSDLPEDYVFPIMVRGTALKPEVDWIGAGKELAELLVQHRVAKDLPCLAPFLQRTMTCISQVGRASWPKPRIPPPIAPFPWQY